MDDTKEMMERHERNYGATQHGVHVPGCGGKLRVALDDLVDRVHEVLLRDRLLAGAVVLRVVLEDGWR